jgi:hypothetical protein
MRQVLNGLDMTLTSLVNVPNPINPLDAANMQWVLNQLSPPTLDTVDDPLSSDSTDLPIDF